MTNTRKVDSKSSKLDKADKKGRRDARREQGMKVITDAIRNGCTVFDDACTLSGFSRQQVYEWLHKGEADVEAGKDTEYSRFYLGCQVADAQLVDELTSLLLTEARDGNVVAIKALLAAKRPEAFGSKSQVMVSGDPEAPLVVALAYSDQWPNPEGQQQAPRDEDGDEIPAGNCIKVKVTDGTKDVQ